LGWGEHVEAEGCNLIAALAGRLEQPNAALSPDSSPNRRRTLHRFDVHPFVGAYPQAIGAFLSLAHKLHLLREHVIQATGS
jgi:hypothetical protein